MMLRARVCGGAQDECFLTWRTLQVNAGLSEMIAGVTAAAGK